MVELSCLVHEFSLTNEQYDAFKKAWRTGDWKTQHALVPCMMCQEAVRRNIDRCEGLKLYWEARHREEDEERKRFTLPHREGYVVIPSHHLYGRSQFHLACSTYSCGTCDGGGCEDCEPIYVKKDEAA